MASQSQPKYLTLESLRGIAALMVALFHFNFAVEKKLPLIAQGDIFVDFFFVLSGFVIAFAYDRKIRERMSFSDFFILRLGRLYPLHLAILLLWLPYILAKYYIHTQTGMGSDPTEQNNAYSFALNLGLVHSLGLFNSLSWNGPSWSISVELAAYLIFFTLVTLTRGVSGKIIFPVISLASYAILISVSDETLLRTYDYGIFRCLGGFFAGAALQSWFAGKSFSLSRAGSTAIEVAALAVMLGCVSQITGSTTFEALSFATFALVIFVFSMQDNGLISSILKHPKLVYLGTISYSLYMVHAIVAYAALDVALYIFKMDTAAGSGVGDAGAKLVVTPWAPLLMIAYLAFITLISHITFTLIERPFRDRAKAWVANRKAARAAIAA